MTQPGPRRGSGHESPTVQETPKTRCNPDDVQCFRTASAGFSIGDRALMVRDDSVLVDTLDGDAKAMNYRPDGFCLVGRTMREHYD